MRSSLLLVIVFQVLSIHGHAAVTTSEDLLLAMLDDGCARPIADESAGMIQALPPSCLKTLFDEEAVVDIDIPKRVRDWGSNGLGGKSWQYEQGECNEFFVALHKRIAAHMPRMRLSPHDLFHGHLLRYGPTGKDHLAVVFHAKEYPSNLELVKNNYQVEDESFSSLDEEFRHRNFLYLSHRETLGVRNEIYLIEERGMCADFFSQLSANSLSEGVMEMVLENGKILGDVNVFLAQALPRIKYTFYPKFDFMDYEIIEDYEAIDTGKTLWKRMAANQMIDSLVSYLAGTPLVYFLTGRS